MNAEEDKLINTDYLYKDLTFAIRGAIFEVANKYGKGFKESIYQNALIEQLIKINLLFEAQKRITIYSLDTAAILGYYTPDLIVEDKVVIEIKATEFTTKQNFEQGLSYLKASKYEVGLLVNFNTPKLYIKRFVYTNDRKPFVSVNQ